MLEKRDGAAIIKRADGSTFRITVEEHTSKSPFDGILEITRDSRRRGKRYLLIDSQYIADIFDFVFACIDSSKLHSTLPNDISTIILTRVSG